MKIASAIDYEGLIGVLSCVEHVSFDIRRTKGRNS